MQNYTNSAVSGSPVQASGTGTFEVAGTFLDVRFDNGGSFGDFTAHAVGDTLFVNDAGSAGGTPRTYAFVR